MSSLKQKLSDFYHATSTNKQLVDQTAHVIVGTVIVSIAIRVFGFNPLVALAVFMSLAVYREYVQHDYSFNMGVGAYRDLAFWFVGAMLGMALST